MPALGNPTLTETLTNIDASRRQISEKCKQKKYSCKQQEKKISDRPCFLDFLYSRLTL